MARRRSHPKLVADALRQVVLRIDPDRKMAAYRVWTFWADAVGPAVASHAEPATFRDGVLCIRVAGAAWMQELQYMKDELREKLNARLGRALIRDIYFVSGAITPQPPRRMAGPPTRPDDSEPAVELPPLKDARMAEIVERLTRAARTRGRR